MFSKSLFRRSKSSILLMTFLIIVSVIISLVLKRTWNSIESEIQSEIAPSVWGDIVIQWTKALENDLQGEIAELVSRQWWSISQKVEMNYTLTTSEWPLLVSLRWVDNQFPLYGEFEWLEKIWDQINNDTNIRISKVLYETLARWDGGLLLKSDEYQVEWIFSSAPGASLSIFDGGRQVIIPLSLARELDLLVLWSRVTYQTLIILPETSNERIKQVQQEIKEILWDISWFRVRTLGESEGVFQSVLESLSGYLWLINLIFLLLKVCVLIFLWSRIVHENQSTIQIMRIYWLRNHLIWWRSLMWVAWSIAVWGLLWIIITYYLSIYLFSLDLLSSISRRFFDYVPVLAWIALLTLGVTALPNWLATRQWPLSLLDQSPVPLSKILWWKQICGWLVFVLLSYYIIIGSVVLVIQHIGAVMLLWVIVWVIISLLHKFLYMLWSRAWWRKSRFELRDILRFLTKPGTNSSLITWGCTVLMILLSWLVMTYAWLQVKLQSLTAWWDSVFVTNVFDEDLEKIDQLSFPVNDVFSLILWRIVSINNISLDTYLSDVAVEGEQRRWFTREFNITTNDLNDVKITSWSPLINEWEVSVDEEFAKRLWLALSDQVVISIAWREFSLTIVNTRSSERDGVRPFFYFQVLDSEFENAPKTSFFQFATEKENKASITSEIVSVMWNNVSFLDTWEIIAQVKGYLERIWLLLSILFWLMFVYAMSAIFSVFRYSSIFQRPRFDVYTLLWASWKLISSLKTWYVSIYILIAWVISLLSFVAFFLIFRWSEVLDITVAVFGRGVWVIVLVWICVWVWWRIR